MEILPRFVPGEIVQAVEKKDRMDLNYQIMAVNRVPLKRLQIGPIS